jgi:hypothetical protein
MLSEVEGGLGSQLFGIFSVFSRAYRVGIPYVLPFEKSNPKAKGEYRYSELLKNIIFESYSTEDCSRNRSIIYVERFRIYSSKALFKTWI